MKKTRRLVDSKTRQKSDSNIDSDFAFVRGSSRLVNFAVMAKFFLLLMVGKSLFQKDAVAVSLTNGLNNEVDRGVRGKRGSVSHPDQWSGKNRPLRTMRTEEMAKSRIIKDLINEAVDIETALNRLYLLACDIGDSRLKAWTQNELQGYSKGMDLPEYRKYRSYMPRYSGMMGYFEEKNVTFQPELLPPEELNDIPEIYVYQSVREIMNDSAKKEDMMCDMGWSAGQIHDATDGQIQATHISQIYPAYMFQDILSAIKQKTIQELIVLENEYGNLDRLEIQADDDPEYSILE